jgi:glycosyltransferase involved in cell wall biosynthesis
MNNQIFTDYYLFADDLAEVNTISQRVIFTINPFLFLIAEKDKEFKKALAEKLELLINNPALRQQMGKAGRKKNEQEFTLNKFE